MPVRSGTGRCAGLLVSMVTVALAALGCAPSPPVRLSPPIPGDQLDLTGFATQPCDLLRADRVSRRHLDPHGTVTVDTGTTICRWNTLDPTHPSMAAGADLHHDLEWVYRHRADFGTFQPTDVSHYPAVDTTTGRPGATGGGVDGGCTTRVGVAADSLLITTARYPGPRPRSAKDPCAAAEAFAFEIITQMMGSS